MTKHHVYVCYRSTGGDDAAFLVFCETCLAGSSDLATKTRLPQLVGISGGS